MKEIQLAAIALLLFLAVGGAAFVLRKFWQTPKDAAWSSTHEVANGQTLVYAQRLQGGQVQRHLVATIDDSSPDFDALFLEACSKADQRVAVLNMQKGISS